MQEEPGVVSQPPLSGQWSIEACHGEIWETLPSLCRMLVSCPVSCNQCKNKCDDNNVYCKVEPCEDPDDKTVVDFASDQNSDDKDDIYSLQDWADLGECTKNPDYMNIYCQKVGSQSFSRTCHVNTV